MAVARARFSMESTWNPTVLGQFCQSVRDAAVVKMHGICCGPQGSGLQV